MAMPVDKFIEMTTTPYRGRFGENEIAPLEQGFRLPAAESIPTPSAKRTLSRYDYFRLRAEHKRRAEAEAILRSLPRPATGHDD
jgi:hypothetical protein